MQQRPDANGPVASAAAEISGAAEVSALLGALTRAEQLRHALGIGLLRLAAATAFFGLFVLLGRVLGVPGWEFDARVFALYWALCGALVLLSLRSATFAPLLGLTIPLVDLPLVFFIQASTFATSNPSGVAGFTVGIFVFLVLLTTLSLRWWLVVVTAAAAILLEGTLQRLAHVAPGAIAASALLLVLAAAACIYGQRRLLGLLGAAVEQALQRRVIETRLVQTDRLATLGTLTANVAHDVKNPMSYVLSNVDYLRHWAERASPGLPLSAKTLDDLRATLGDVAEGADRVRLLVRDLTLLSRGGALVHEGRALDLGRAVASAANVCRSEIAKRARLETHLGPGSWVLGDEARLGQVFVNLLMNAAQAIPEGHPEQNSVGIALCTLADGRCAVEVRDSGQGIPAAVRERIFEPFFTTKPPDSGTGLGLSICRQIVSEHGGDIEVESEVGKGTTFRVTLPGLEPTAHG